MQVLIMMRRKAFFFTVKLIYVVTHTLPYSIIAIYYKWWLMPQCLSRHDMTRKDLNFECIVTTPSC